MVKGFCVRPVLGNSKVETAFMLAALHQHSWERFCAGHCLLKERVVQTTHANCPSPRAAGVVEPNAMGFSSLPEASFQDLMQLARLH